MKKLLFLTLALFTSLTFSQSLRVGKFDQLTTNDPAGTEVEISKDVYINSTGGLYLPEGTTLERPTPFQDGMLRYNSDLGAAEIYSVGEWKPVGSGGISLWETAKAYKIDDVVIESDLIYRALTDHTSGTFATDLANGDWTEVSALPQPLDTTDSPTFNNVTITDPDYDISNLGKEIAFNQSTGVRSGGDLSVDVDPTKFDMAALEAQIIDSTVNGAPTRNEFTCPAFNAQTVNNLATQDVTYILVDASCTITQQASFPSASERRAKAFVGRLNHSNRTSVLFANTIADYLQSPMSQVYDLMNSLGAFNIGDGNRISANGANLSMNKSAGEMFVASYNYTTNNQSPNNVTNAARTLFSFRYATQTTLSGSNVTVLDPTNYDNAGTITAIGGGASSASVQRVYLFPSNNITVQYGQTTYSNLAAAIQGIQSETFVVTPTSKGLSIPVAFIAIQKNCTSLLDTSCSKIIVPNQFGGTSGASVGGSTTLQQAYGNSSQPQIETDATRGALQIKRGSLLDTDVVTEVLNGAGSSTFSVTGNGAVSASSTITATGNITGANLSGTNTGDLTSQGQSEGAAVTTNKLETNYNQLNTTASGTRLIEGLKNNVMANGSFENLTYDTGWTCSLGTKTKETTTVFKGVNSMKIESAGAGTRCYNYTTTDAARLKGQQGHAIVRVNSNDSILYACTLAGGTTSSFDTNCTAVPVTDTNAPWKTVVIPFIWDGTGNGIVLKSAETLTKSVYIDESELNHGLPVQGTNGARLLGTVKITGCAGAWSTTAITFSSFATQTGCTYTVTGEALAPSTNIPAIKFNNIPAGELRLEYNGAIFSATANHTAEFRFHDGTDYAKEFAALLNLNTTTGNQSISLSDFTQSFTYPVAKTNVTLEIRGRVSNAANTATISGITAQAGLIKVWHYPPASTYYSQASSDTDWTSCGHTTSDFVGFGTVSGIETQCKRQGSDLLMRGKFVAGTPTATEARIGLKLNGSSLTSAGISTIPSLQLAGDGARGVAQTGSIKLLLEPSVTYFTMSLWDGSNSALTKANGNSLLSTGNSFSFLAKAPIQGWQDYNVINGSFAGIEKCANAHECTDEYSATISSANAVSNPNVTNWISSATWSPAGTLTVVYGSGLKDGTSSLSSPMNCVGVSSQNGQRMTVSSTTTSQVVFENRANDGTANATAPLAYIKCSKGTQDYTPKTAKVATSIGVPTVPGIVGNGVGERVDTFSVAYGGASISTVCAASSTCTLYNQIGNGFTSITQGTAGFFTANFSKTYTKVNCTANPLGAASLAGIVNSGSTPPLSCSNCNSLAFVTGNPAVAYVATYGTIDCKGTY